MEVQEYDLFIDLDFQHLHFSGRALIKLRTEQDIVLNSVGLRIIRVSSESDVLHFRQQGEDLRIETGRFDGAITIDYSGSIPDSLTGIYRAPYDGTHIVTTQFEAAQARRMFPCVDRPDMKAKFRLSVRIDRDLDAISNMPIESVKAEDGKKTVTFQKTPRMSTYLLYLGVGKFELRTGGFEGTDIVLATTPGKTKYVDFAQEEVRRALSYFNSYFGIPYMLPKLHLIAVPEFAMGAMENWGAITFRESRLLVDHSTGTKTRMQVSLALAHELAHQWFGDLVTMKWWDDIWLNESFASLMAYKAVDALHPDWEIWRNFYNGEPKVETLATALARDSLRSTHPIHVPVESPDEIEQIFDAISYGKGAHVLQMIEAYVGEESFREGVRRYLTTHAYSNASGEDFWLALQEASKKPISKIVENWLHQPGYPVVTALERNGMLHLRQDRFLLSGEPDKATWQIPIVFEVNGERRSILMGSVQEAMQVGPLGSLKFNPDRKGFYIVHYQGLEQAVGRSKLSPYDRWGIVFDAIMLLLSGRISFDDYMTTLRRFEGESDPLPVQEISDQLDLLWTLMPAKLAETSREFHKALLAALERKMDENSSIVRGMVAARLAVLDQDYASELARDFETYESIAPDMKRAVAIAYARATADFERLAAAFGRTGSDEDKNRLLGAMTTFTDATLVKRTLDLALSGEVKRQDAIFVIIASSWNPQARDMTWRFLESNIEKLRNLYQSTSLLSEAMLRIIPILGVGRVQEVEDFFRSHKIPEADAGIRSGMEILQAYDRLVRTVAQT